jgi:chromosome segregation ATPase
MDPKRTRSDPVGQVEARLAEVQREHAQLSLQVEAAKAQQRKLSAEMRTLEAHLQLTKSPSAARSAVLQAGSLGDATAGILEEAGRPMRIVELVRELQDAGKLLRSEWAYSTLAKMLVRDARFARALGQRGYWELAAKP